MQLLLAMLVHKTRRAWSISNTTTCLADTSSRAASPTASRAALKLVCSAAATEESWPGHGYVHMPDAEPPQQAGQVSNRLQPIAKSAARYDWQQLVTAYHGTQALEAGVQCG